MYMMDKIELEEFFWEVLMAISKWATDLERAQVFFNFIGVYVPSLDALGRAVPLYSNE